MVYKDNTKRYQVNVQHGEGVSTFSVVDTWQPEREQPCVLHSWTTRTEPNAAFLARDFCERHNEAAIAGRE